MYEIKSKERSDNRLVT